MCTYVKLQSQKLISCYSGIEISTHLKKYIYILCVLSVVLNMFE